MVELHEWPRCTPPRIYIYIYIFKEKSLQCAAYIPRTFNTPDSIDFVLSAKHTVHTWCSQIHMPRMTLQTLHSTAFRLQTLHFTLQTPHLTLGTKCPTLHFTFSILNTTSENHTLQTVQSTPCTLHPPVATLRTPDANSTFHMPTSALYTLH